MSEWKPCIVQIERIEQHNNADTLEIAKVLGDYPVIVKKGEYKVGDLATYIPEDTIVPDTKEFHFLSPNKTERIEENGEIKDKVVGKKFVVGVVPEKYRVIRAKKIRQVYSEGLLIPVPEGFSLGDSVIDHFGLKKYDEQEESHKSNFKFNVKVLKDPNSGNKNYFDGQLKKPNGWDIPYYDIDPLRSLYDELKEEEEIVCLEKLHGSQLSAVHDGEKLWVKSRNNFRKRYLSNYWWDVAIRSGLEEKLAKYPMLAFYGELVGLQKNRTYHFAYDADIDTVNNTLTTKLHFFHIYDIKNQRMLSYDEFVKIAKDLELPIVPELYRGPLLPREQLYSLSERMSTINQNHVCEGFVLQTLNREKNIEMKHISEGYKLSK